ncbi:unnamed protein product [Durusdinium trenchii]|uniref:Uncharacterized protein n=2 Tax=Durusdinium trenchii TaxID=1381693 RepID=A0ABP0S392_9DINO
MSTGWNAPRLSLRPSLSPKPSSRTASTFYERSPLQSWSIASHSECNTTMDASQRYLEPVTQAAAVYAPQLGRGSQAQPRCTSPDFPRHEGQRASRAGSEDATAFGTEAEIHWPSLPPGSLMLDPEPAEQIPRPSLSLIESDLEELYAAARAPHFRTRNRPGSSQIKEVETCGEPEDRLRRVEPAFSRPSNQGRDCSSRTSLRCPCCFQPAPVRRKSGPGARAEMLAQDSCASPAEPSHPRSGRRLTAQPNVQNQMQHTEMCAQEKLENFRMGAFGQMPNRDRACSQLAAEASSQTARSKTRQTEVVMPKWEEADVFAEPGLELQQLAQKRRSMTKALRKRLQHMEKHCGILSEDYQRLAGLDTELYRVVANLRHAFAREQEALADRRHSAGPELCRSRTDFTKGSN